MADVAFTQLRVGAEIPPLTRLTTHTQLFRFSAVTWNAHRIHYDKDYAAQEGYPDILVQAHLYGAFLAQMLADWTGPGARLVELEWSNRRMALVGEALTCKGVVTRLFEQDGQGCAECDIRVENERGEVAVPGRAILAFPLGASERRETHAPRA